MRRVTHGASIQIVPTVDRAAVFRPSLQLCRDSQPIAASSSAAREDALSGCRRARSDRARHALAPIMQRFKGNAVGPRPGRS
jgi:hypothetical protein